MNQESRLEHNPNNSNLHRKIATYVKVSAIHACPRFAIANLSRQIICYVIQCGTEFYARIMKL